MRCPSLPRRPERGAAGRGSGAGLLDEASVGVGVFPGGEDILIGDAGSRTGQEAW
jgi:hypothetical protein